MAQRPADIPAGGARFDRFAEAASRFVSEAAFFTVCALLVDAVATGIAAVLRHQADGDADGLRSALADLEAAIGLEERI